MSSNAKPTDGFKTRLKAAVRAAGTGLCVGIDPHADQLPPFFARELETKGPAAFLTAYSTTLVDAAVGVAPAVKFQSAFYEAFGAEGFQVLARMLARAKAKGLVTILDAKRGDIASTMAAYGQMAFGHMDADSLTVTPYMGLDVLAPLAPWLRQGRGAYVVWWSSNPAGALVQDAVAAPLFEALVAACREGGFSEALGLVVGATRIGSLPPRLKARLGEAALLMPGVGAQGGVVTPQIEALVRETGTVLVPQSRSVGGYDPQAKSWDDFGATVAERARAEAVALAIKS